VLSDTTLHAAARGACEQLMIVINANDLNKIEGAVADLQAAAETYGVLLAYDPHLRRADGAWKRRVMAGTVFITALVLGIFGWDFTKRWWKETEWKRRLRKPPEE
jgi:hypothetical protein